jgi:hypothetical protein
MALLDSNGVILASQISCQAIHKKEDTHSVKPREAENYPKGNKI